MFERYTEKARRVIFFARYEASQFGSPYIETEHFLLGLLREDKAMANRFLGSYAVLDSIRQQIEGHTKVRGAVSTSVDLPLSRECKRILAYGAEEAERLGHKHIGPEHLLIGILIEEKCFAAALLHEHGLLLSGVRADLLSGKREEGASTAVAPRAPRVAPAIAFGRFTERARRAFFFAYQEAGESGSPTIETEHLLLGVLREDNLQATLLLRTDAAVESIRRQIEAENPPGEETPANGMPLTDECQRALRVASALSERLGHKEIETGHLLLGILDEDESFAAEILRERGLSISTVSEELTGN